MRKTPVAAESALWRLLRDRRLEGMKFRRQVPLGPYVADFVCFRHRLIIEADGPFHSAERDAQRDGWLMSQMFRVLRFKNDEIIVWPERVLDRICEAVGHEPIFQGPLSNEPLLG